MVVRMTDRGRSSLSPFPASWSQEPGLHAKGIPSVPSALPYRTYMLREEEEEAGTRVLSWFVIYLGLGLGFCRLRDVGYLGGAEGWNRRVGSWDGGEGRGGERGRKYRWGKESVEKGERGGGGGGSRGSVAEEERWEMGRGWRVVE